MNLDTKMVNRGSGNTYVVAAEIRRAFAKSMSAMYRDEVPAYGQLLDIVEAVNIKTIAEKGLKEDDIDMAKITEERHGAIRLGLPAELAVMRRLFVVMGMFPVGYYDLSVAGLPVHSTAFRPISQQELQLSPFRMFTSLLRLELIEDAGLRKKAEAILAERNIFSDSLLVTIELFEKQGGLTEAQAVEFVSAAVDVFRWHQQANVDQETYIEMKNLHPLIADIVCFKGSHINHLTPRTLDIDDCQQAMKQQGLQAKKVIEGPPKRSVDILLRQTAFMALTESFFYASNDSINNDKDSLSVGQHTARFGEIEQRGMALTPKGRALYDRLLQQVEQKIKTIESNPSGKADTNYSTVLTEVFMAFPDDLEQIKALDLGYFMYYLKDQAKPVADIKQGIVNGDVLLKPMVYEDFLPVSAAGIFRANLGDAITVVEAESANQFSFEQALGRPVIDPFHWYDRQQQASIASCLQHN